MLRKRNAAAYHTGLLIMYKRVGNNNDNDLGTLTFVRLERASGCRDLRRVLAERGIGVICDETHLPPGWTGDSARRCLQRGRDCIQRWGDAGSRNAEHLLARFPDLASCAW